MELDFRKQSVDARLRKDPWELTFELLPEMLCRVDADGFRPLNGEDIHRGRSVRQKSYPVRCAADCREQEWYRVR